MADTAAPTPLRRREKVVAATDLIGVPAGTPGRVSLVQGLGPWIRYRVLFANGVDRGSILREHLARPGEVTREYRAAR